MALVDNKLGDFTFLSFMGDPDLMKEQIEIVVRPGVDGVGLWKTGSRGSPFSLRSAVDKADFAAARAEANLYRDLIGADPVELIWNDVDMAAAGILVAVLDVRPLRVLRLLRGVGGLNPPSRGWVEAEWTLLPIANS